jgi:uncharacterized protein YbjT (DUF2867 family)
MKPLITVVGATSKQGRSVAHALLESGRYQVRALTRRRDSEPAQALARRGAELVVVPLQPGIQAALTAAMRGSVGAFLMTPPIDPHALSWEQFLKRSHWQGEPLTFGALSNENLT